MENCRCGTSTLTLRYGAEGPVYDYLLAVDILPAEQEMPINLLMPGRLSYESIISSTSLDKSVRNLSMPRRASAPTWLSTDVYITGEERVILTVGDSFEVSSARGFVLKNSGEGNYFISRIGGPAGSFLLHIYRSGYVSTATSLGFGVLPIHFRPGAAIRTKARKPRTNPDINWNKAGRHWKNLHTTVIALKDASDSGELDSEQEEPVTRGEEGIPRRRTFDQGEFDLGHQYLSEDQAKIRELDDMIDLVQSLGGTGGGMSDDDIDLTTSNIDVMHNFLDKTQDTWREFLGSIDPNCEGQSGLFFDCLSSYIDASIGMLGRSHRQQIRKWARSLATDRDALVETLQLSPDRESAAFDWWPSPELENRFINY